MIYRVMLDGTSIYDEGKDLALISPSVEMELNTAGKFEFTMPSNHSFIDMPKMLTSDVEVYEDNTLIWFGRPLDISKDFFNRKKIYCEGALAYFNDSIQRPAEYNEISIKTFFTQLISNHNGQVPANRRFTVGNITIPEEFVYRKLDYETTFDAIQTMCLNAEGGYIFTRRENGVNYVDWLKDMPYVGDQPVQFALNILDLNQIMSGADIKTSVIPLGAETDGVRLTVISVNGDDYVDSDAVATYGRITTVEEFSDITSAAELLTAGRKWLVDQQFDPLSIEIDAAELHYITNSYTPFRVGQTIHCTSTPHLIDRDFPLVKITLNLDTAKKKITIGSLPRRQLTEIYKKS